MSSDNERNFRRLFVTGASGFLGWNLCSEAKKTWDVTGVFHTHPVSREKVKNIRIDLTDYALLRKSFSDIAPDAVIHTAAAANPNYCQEHPSESREINIKSSINLAGLCADAGIPFVHTSTDLVFDGSNAPYKEEDSVNPLNTYAEQKVLAEEEVLRRYPEAAVCRMPLMFGESSPAYQTFFQQMVHALRQGDELKLFTDEFRTPVSGRTAAKGLLLAVDRGKNILHLGGQERISRFNFGLLLMDSLGIREANLVRCMQKDIAMSAPRAPDLSLDSTKAYALGYKPMPLKEELAELFRE